jgi:hypothetical protein
MLRLKHRLELEETTRLTASGTCVRFTILSSFVYTCALQAAFNPFLPNRMASEHWAPLNIAQLYVFSFFLCRMLVSVIR